MPLIQPSKGCFTPGFSAVFAIACPDRKSTNVRRNQWLFLGKCWPIVGQMLASYLQASFHGVGHGEAKKRVGGPTGA
jgi:hypothetical protein